jgi:hypothetical protein
MVALASATRRPLATNVILPAIFHPEIVALTGLLASDRWEHRLFAGNGGLRRFVAEITRREVLAGHELEETDDPLYQWITGRIALHKFTRYYPRSFGALHPEETTRPTRNRPARDFRLIPLPPY